MIVKSTDVQVDRSFENAEIERLNAALSEPWGLGEEKRLFRLSDEGGYNEYGKSALGDYLIELLRDAGWRATYDYQRHNKHRTLIIYRPKP